ncbi:hypothetical protein PR001_g26256 [Phytophthora rubi]|uniref:Uncharacterized protein n=1 Tax=Phytophthora rubi TaxID=129364 RepID=A0A6A3HZK4_9STRA|nr:hypothetical protein PR001_g26256 [Phytophthora rubi]
MVVLSPTYLSSSSMGSMSPAPCSDGAVGKGGELDMPLTAN